jgi:hypothetical protein
LFRRQSLTDLAIEEKTNNEPLLKEIPVGGSIVSETGDEKFGTTVYQLSNGVKAVIKPTDFKDDEIVMQATSPGGSSHFPETEEVNIKLYSSVAGLGGLGNFSPTDLSKALSGKKVSVNQYMNLIYEGLSGSSSVKDFETMLQLIYLNFNSGERNNRFNRKMENIKSTVFNLYWTVLEPTLKNRLKIDMQQQILSYLLFVHSWLLEIYP